MRITVIFILIALTILSCNETRTDLAIKWTSEIKMKILEDVKGSNDSFSVDTTHPDINYVSLYRKSVKTKEFGIQKSDGDIVVSIFHSKNQKFELVRELCPAFPRSSEGIKYEGKYLGLHELKFCNGKLKEQGFCFNGDVGIRTEWNENGEVIKETDYGFSRRLKDLSKIKYNQ